MRACRFLNGAKPGVIFLLAIILFAQCKTKEEGSAEIVRNSPEPENFAKEEEPLTLEDSIQQIRKWFNIINNNAAVNNYNTDEYKIATDSSEIEIIEYTNKNENERQKVIIKANNVKYDLPGVKSYHHISRLTREYYYWRKKKFFVYETLQIRDSTSGPYQVENRYYFGDNNMIRWICGKQEVERTDSSFKTLQAVFVQEGNTLLQVFDYFRNNRQELHAPDKDQLLNSFYEVLSLRHPDNDSIKVVFTSLHENKYLFEVYNSEALIAAPSSVLYLFTLSEVEDKWYGDEQTIGRLGKSVDIETPGDFLYYLMHLNKVNDTTSLRRVIPKEGYETNVTVAIGDVEPQYEHHWQVLRDTLQFYHLDFDFTPSIFDFHVTIDEQFDENGRASISYWGGGFGESVQIRQTKQGVYLVSHHSQDH